MKLSVPCRCIEERCLGECVCLFCGHGGGRDCGSPRTQGDVYAAVVDRLEEGWTFHQGETAEAVTVALLETVRERGRYTGDPRWQ